MIFMSFVGMGLIWYINSLGWFQFSFIGLFFIMIAVMTLPHMLLVEQLYDKFKNQTIMSNTLALSSD